MRQHPEIFVAAREGHFFDRERYFQSANVDYASYHQAFSPIEQQWCVGESTPVYMYWKPAAKRIFQYNPDMKFLILLRCPVARAYSAWNMEWNRGRDTMPFIQAIQSEADRIKQALPDQLRVSSYIDRGFYAQQLESLWQYFPRSQTLVLPSKQFKQAPQDTLRKVCDFLELPPLPNFKPQQAQVGSYKSFIPLSEKEALQAVFSTENRRLEQLLGWNSEHWLD